MSFAVGLYRDFGRQGRITFRTLPATKSSDEEKLRLSGINSGLRSAFAITRLDRLFDISDKDAGVRMLQEPRQRTAEQARSTLKSCGVVPGLELQASLEARNVTAEGVHDDLDEINTMVSEGSPTR